jgi:hypothetical protein
MVLEGTPEAEGIMLSPAQHQRSSGSDSARLLRGAAAA